MKDIIIGNDWQKFIDQESKKKYFQDLYSFLLDEYKTSGFYPKPEDVFNAFRLTPICNTKVVIIGQDCYHDDGQAMGLAFSVRDEMKMPPSLRNIKTELDDEDVLREPWSQDLTRWATQGVMLLNTILTVRPHEPLSHANHGWEVFTDNAIREIEKCDNPIVYLLWGRNAQSKQDLITNPNHTYYKSAHPSPLSANRGFFGNRHFQLANNFLIDNNVEPVRW